MSDVLAKLRKRRSFPVTVGEETFYVRSATIGELRRFNVVPDDDKAGFSVGCRLLSADGGEQEFPQQEGEDDNTWAKRVTESLVDVPTETIVAIIQASAKADQVPKTADIIKN